MNLHRLQKLKLDHPPDDHLDHRPPKKRWGIFLFAVLILAGAAVAYFVWPRLRPTEQKETVAKAFQEQTPAPAPVIADTFTAAGYLEIQKTLDCDGNLRNLRGRPRQCGYLDDEQG